MRNIVLMAVALLFLTSCSEKYRKINREDVVVSSKLLDSVVKQPKTQTEIREDLLTKGYQVFDVLDDDTNETVIMQQYFIVFLKGGSKKIKKDEESKRLQKQHLDHYSKMYDLGYMDISGPLGDVGEIQSICIYNVPTLKMADSLANADPMVKSGHLLTEVHPWWVPKGYALR